MSNSVREVTNQSWFSRIGKAFFGVLFGLLLFAAAFPLLFWNEGRSVKTYKTLAEGEQNCVPVPSAGTVDPAREGTLIHLNGTAETEETLTDSAFNVSAAAIKLKRQVEMYQWVERSKSRTRKKMGGGTETVTEYTYHTSWESQAIDSSSFREQTGHHNPGFMPYKPQYWTAALVTLGAFRLSENLISQIDTYRDLALPQDTTLPADKKEQSRLLPNGFYIAASPGTLTNTSEPQIGDIRITYQSIVPLNVSVIAKQRGSSFEPYVSQAGGTIERLDTGTLTAQQMFEKMKQENAIMTWLLRGAGFLMMFIGLNLIFRPLAVLADVIPILGSIIAAGAGLISFFIAAPFALITIAVAWVFYRPVLGISLLVIAAVLIVIVISLMKKGRSSTG